MSKYTHLPEHMQRWKHDPRRVKYGERFDIPMPKRRKRLPGRLLDMLDGCKDDEARRLLLGVSA
jgi:hypothetical protein